MISRMQMLALGVFLTAVALRSTLVGAVAVLLGVAASLDYLWSTPLAIIPSTLVNLNGHEPFHRIAAPIASTEYPA